MNVISGEIVDAAMAVHSALGPGLLESAYTACLAYELRSRGLHVEVEVPMPIVYRGVRINVGYRLDMLVEERVVVENKAAARLSPVHSAQLLSHLKLGHFKLGLLINFHELHLRNGIRRMMN